MTGLDIAKDHIIEICCIITDGNLNIIDQEGYESTVHVPKKVLDNMNEWCVNQHGKSGLTAKVLANPLQTLAKVQLELLEYIKLYVPQPRVAILAGNSIHMDKFFMMKEFPQVIEHLHYRLVDVSSIMEVGFRHNPALMKLFPKKQGNHTAKSDILESINQLKWYRSNYLRKDIPEGLQVPADRREEPPSKKARVEKTAAPGHAANEGCAEATSTINGTSKAETPDAAGVAENVVVATEPESLVSADVDEVIEVDSAGEEVESVVTPTKAKARK